LLLARDSEGITVWHVAARRGKLDLYQIIWEWAVENLTAEEIKYKTLLDTENLGLTGWQLAVEFGELDLLQKIWE
jgi:hypothetical protein